MLLAAGRSTRLRPLTDHCPKCLLDLGGETILGRALRQLRARGVRKLTLVDGFEGDRIRAAVAAGSPDLDVTWIRNDDYATTNNAFSLRLALAAHPAEEILLLDSDIACEDAVLDAVLDYAAPNRLGLRTRGDIGAEEMKVGLDGSGRVIRLSKEIPPAEAAGESVGLEVFAPDFVAALRTVLDRRLDNEGRVNEYYEEAFTELAVAGHVIAPIDLGHLRCLEIDTPADLAAARREFGGP